VGEQELFIEIYPLSCFAQGGKDLEHSFPSGGRLGWGFKVYGKLIKMEF